MWWGKQNLAMSIIFLMMMLWPLSERNKNKQKNILKEEWIPWSKIKCSSEDVFRMPRLEFDFLFTLFKLLSKSEFYLSLYLSSGFCITGKLSISRYSNTWHTDVSHTKISRFRQTIYFSFLPRCFRRSQLLQLESVIDFCKMSLTDFYLYLSRVIPDTKILFSNRNNICFFHKLLRLWTISIFRSHLFSV